VVVLAFVYVTPRRERAARFGHPPLGTQFVRSNSWKPSMLMSSTRPTPSARLGAVTRN
jgi:hypothetical protein